MVLTPAYELTRMATYSCCLYVMQAQTHAGAALWAAALSAGPPYLLDNHSHQVSCNYAQVQPKRIGSTLHFMPLHYQWVRYWVSQFIISSSIHVMAGSVWLWIYRLKAFVGIFC